MCASFRKLHLAIKGLKIAIHLDSNAPYIYTKLAEIYESDLKDEESTKEVLLKGIEKCDDKAPLYVKLGDYHFKMIVWKKQKHCILVLWKKIMMMFILISDLHKFIWQENNTRKQKEYILGIENKLKRAKIFL